METYEEVVECYKKIFWALELPFAKGLHLCCSCVSCLNVYSFISHGSSLGYECDNNSKRAVI